jgi:hypothetical protein
MERALQDRKFPNTISKLMFAWVAACAAMTGGAPLERSDYAAQ